MFTVQEKNEIDKLINKNSEYFYESIIMYYL